MGIAGKAADNADDAASIAGCVAGAKHVRSVAELYGVPVVLHTDHCQKAWFPWFDGMLKANEEYFAKNGVPLFSSHMLDLSEEPLEENIALCKDYLEKFAKMGILLEFELGVTGGEEDGVDNTDVDASRLYTQPEEVFYAYEELSKVPNGAFTCAASFGNVHGVYAPGNVELRPVILHNSQKYIAEKIGSEDPKPMRFVFHGGSGSSKEDIQYAIEAGVIKMNIDTDTQWAFWDGLRQYESKYHDYLQGQIGNPEGDDKPNKKFYDSRCWVRESEITMCARVIESCTDLKNSVKLIFSRHGESEWNVANRFTGWVDVDLSPKGVEEAKGAGTLIKEEGIKVDVCFTSVLKRAMRTGALALEMAGQTSVPVKNSWRLNERMYGALQGLDKKETVQKHGAEQVLIWRRSFDLPPPPIEKDHQYYTGKEDKYKGLSDADIPVTESLKDVIARVMPYWKESIEPELKAGRTVLVAAHGNSIRAIVKMLEGISDEVIPTLEIPTATPLVYDLDCNLKPIPSKSAVAPLKYGRYLGDAEKIKAATEAVKNQTKVG